MPITNPFSTAPLFIALTSGFPDEERNRQALRGCVYAFAILVVFLLLGRVIIDFFRISVPGIRIAGGLIILAIGFRMLFPQAIAAAPAAADARRAQPDISFSPLAMPSLAGPGSISVVLNAAAQIQSFRPETWQIIYTAVILGMALTLLLCFLVLRMAGSMVRFLGPSGIDAMTRIFGFLLICISMQFILTGISDFFGIRHGLRADERPLTTFRCRTQATIFAPPST